MKNSVFNNCGCSHNNDHNCSSDGHDHNHGGQKTIHLTLTDNSTMECDVLSIFEAMGRQYIALLPKGKEDALLYKFHETADGPQLNNIETDEEYMEAGKVFTKLFTKE